MPLLVIVPTLNERRAVTGAIRRIVDCLPGADVLVVDDASEDGTAVAARSLRAELPCLDVLERAGGRGLGPSILDGYRYAVLHGYAAACVVDADLQQDPADVHRLAKHAARADVVIGSRFTADRSGCGPPIGALEPHTASRAVNAFLRRLFCVPFTDLTTDFTLFSDRAMRAALAGGPGCRGIASFVETKLLAHRVGLCIEEVGVNTVARQTGESSVSTCRASRFALETAALMRWDIEQRRGEAIQQDRER